MNVKSPTVSPATKTWTQEIQKPAEVKPEAKPTQQPMGPPGYHTDSYTPPTNSAESTQRARGVTTDHEATKQLTATGCGDSTLEQLEKSFFSANDSGIQDYMNELQVNADKINASATLAKSVNVNLEDGYTGDEMSAMLGMRGVKVDRGFDNYDAGFMNTAMQEGKFGVAMVDSNAIFNGRTDISPGQRKEGPGQLHWVTIDGVDTRNSKGNREDDLYRVRDSNSGETYWVSAANLKNSVESAKKNHNSGGVLVVEEDNKARTPQELEQLSHENLNHAKILGKGNGGGGNSKTVAEPSQR